VKLEGIYKTGYNSSAFISMCCAICELGVPTERQTSSSKFCFENTAENFEMIKRAFRDRRWEEWKFFEWFFKFKNSGTSLKMLPQVCC